MSRYFDIAEENSVLKQRIEELECDRGTLLHVVSLVREAVADRQPMLETIAEVEYALEFPGLEHIEK